jgi:tetratricopeptide (TPR) repeat protein
MSHDPVDEAVRLLDEADAERAAGRLARSRAAAERALAIVEAECGGAHPDVANALLMVGGCAEDGGEYGVAEECYRRAAGIMEGFADEPDEVIQRLRVQAGVAVGQIERVLGHLDAAYTTLTAAVAMAEERLGPEDPETATALNALGIVCKYAGRFEEGEAVYQRALATVEATSGPMSNDAASVWHNLGGLAFDAGRYDVAEEPARRAVDIREAALGADHPAVAADVAALAAILDALGHSDEAMALYGRALDVFETTEGADYDLAVLHNNLGVMAAERGESASAEEHYRAALALKERLLSRKHPDVAMTLQNLGVLTGDRDLVEEALRIFESSLGAEHPKVRECQAALAAL